VKSSGSTLPGWAKRRLVRAILLFSFGLAGCGDSVPEFVPRSAAPDVQIETPVGVLTLKEAFTSRDSIASVSGSMPGPLNDVVPADDRQFVVIVLERRQAEVRTQATPLLSVSDLIDLLGPLVDEAYVTSGSGTPIPRHSRHFGTIEGIQFVKVFYVAPLEASDFSLFWPGHNQISLGF
jgi:hypothetical protein